MARLSNVPSCECLSERSHFINHCRIPDITGVAVGSLDGAPALKFFDRLPKTSSSHDIAASTRLDALTKRGRAEGASYPAPNEAVSAETVKRLFRQPDEV